MTSPDTQQPPKKKNRAVEIGKRVVSGLVKKKLLVIGLPAALAIVIALILVIVMFVTLAGVLSGVKSGNEMIYENEQCIDVGSATPRVTAGGGGSGSGSGGGPQSGEGPLGMPVGPGADTVTSGFGMRWGAMHDGMDFAGPEAYGAPIYAPADGVVTAAGPASGYGNWVRIMHDIDGEKVETLYGHMEDGHVHVSEGDKVSAGEHIADIGNAGTSTGAHLHFGVYPGGWAQGNGVDPQPWLAKFKGEAGAGESNGEEDTQNDAESGTVNLDATDFTLAADTQVMAQDSGGGNTVTAEDWEKLAGCESGGNWAIDTGNGFSGGLQFTEETWKAFGGEEYAPKASEAGREEQMEVANRVLREQGWGAWPACSGKLSELQGLEPAPEGTFIGKEDAKDSSGEDKDSKDDGGSLPPVPSEVGSEERLQTQTVHMMRATYKEFPELTTIGGYREDSLQWHPNGQALDFMIDDYQSDKGKSLGDSIVGFLQANSEEFGIDHIIWQQRMWLGGSDYGEWEDMDDLGDDTSNHYDHVHVAVTDGGGFPTDATTYDSVSGGREDGGNGESTSGNTIASDSPAANSDLPNLLPNDQVEAEQLQMQINVEQQATVKGIISAAKDSNLEEDEQPRAAVLATMLSAQQANLINLDGKQDFNKVGIFAESPSFRKSRMRLMDPKLVARDFYKELKDEYGDDTSWMTAPAAEVLVRVYPERRSLEVELAKYEYIAADAVAAMWESKGAQAGVTMPQVFEDVEACAIGATAQSGSADPGAALDAGSVPEEFVPFLERAAKECEAVSAPVLAAQLYHEGGFQPHEPRDVGADTPVSGYGQFLASTWAAYGAEVDDEGNVIGEPGSGDPNDVGDAVMAQARYNCANAETIEQWKSEGRLVGEDTTALMLGAYLAGLGGIQDGLGDGVADVNGSTPRSYAETILDLSEQYTDLEGSKNSPLDSDKSPLEQANDEGDDKDPGDKNDDDS